MSQASQLSFLQASTGVVTVSTNTNATSTTTGALIVTGGLAVGKDIYIGGQLNVASTVTFTTSSTLASPKLQAYQETVTQLGTVVGATNINCQL